MLINLAAVGNEKITFTSSSSEAEMIGRILHETELTPRTDADLVLFYITSVCRVNIGIPYSYNGVDPVSKEAFTALISFHKSSFYVHTSRKMRTQQVTPFTTTQSSVPGSGQLSSPFLSFIPSPEPFRAPQKYHFSTPCSYYPDRSQNYTPQLPPSLPVRCSTMTWTLWNSYPTPPLPSTTMVGLLYSFVVSRRPISVFSCPFSSG